MRIGNDATSPRDDDPALDRLLAEARWRAADEAAFSRLRTTLARESMRTSAGHSHWWVVGLAASVVAALIGGALLVRRGRIPRQLVHKPSPPPSIVAAGSPHSPASNVGQIVGPIVGRPANEFEIAMLLSNSPRHINAPKIIVPPVAVAKATVKATGKATANATGNVTVKTRPEDLRALIQSLDDPAARETSIALLAQQIPPVKLVQIAVDPKATGSTRSGVCAALLSAAMRPAQMDICNWSGTRRPTIWRWMLCAVLIIHRSGH